MKIAANVFLLAVSLTAIECQAVLPQTVDASITGSKYVSNDPQQGEMNLDVVPLDGVGGGLPGPVIVKPAELVIEAGTMTIAEGNFK